MDVEESSSGQALKKRFEMIRELDIEENERLKKELKEKGMPEGEMLLLLKEELARRKEKAKKIVQVAAEVQKEFAELLHVYYSREKKEKEELDGTAARSFPITSTPIKENQTLELIRDLDISRVGNSETSFDNSVFKQPISPASKHPFADERDRDEILHGTYSKSQITTSLQGTFTVEKRKSDFNVFGNIDQCDNNGTFIVNPISICKPKRGYLKPTFSSIQKSTFPKSPNRSTK